MTEPTPRSAAPRVPRVDTRGRVRSRAQAMIAGVVPGAASPGLGGFWANAWPFPSIVFSAFLIAWAAECAPFLVSQGMALAIPAWLQALPGFAVEAGLAWGGPGPLTAATFSGSLALPPGPGGPPLLP